MHVVSSQSLLAHAVSLLAALQGSVQCGGRMTRILHFPDLVVSRHALEVEPKPGSLPP